MVEFAEELARRRKEVGLTQQELADEMDVVFQSVHKWEAGHTRPRSSRLHVLAAALKVDEATVREWWAGIEHTDDKGEPLSPRVQQIARHADHLPEHVWRALMTLAEAHDDRHSGD